MSGITSPGPWPVSIKKVLIIGTGAVGVSLLPGWITLLKAWYGLDVRVILTASAERMVSRQVIGALAKSPTLGPDWSADPAGVEHKDIADWADIVIVAPATASYITKLAQGNLDSLSLYVPVVAQASVVIAPSLPGKALEYPPVARALADLSDYGMRVLDMSTGIEAHSLNLSEGGLINIVDLIDFVWQEFGGES